MGFIRGIDRDDLLSCQVALTVVEFAFIPETETALLSAVGAESRGGDEVTDFVSFDLISSC